MEDQDDEVVLASDPNSPDHQCLRQLAKRNRPNTPESEHRTLNDSIAKTQSLLEGLAQLSKLCDYLAKNIDKTTKWDIKDISRKLTRRIGILNRRETWAWLHEANSKQNRNQRNRMPNKYGLRSECKKGISVGNKIKNILDESSDDVEALQQIVDIDWPDDCYTKITKEQGSILDQDTHDTVIPNPTYGEN